MIQCRSIRLSLHQPSIQKKSYILHMYIANHINVYTYKYSVNHTKVFMNFYVYLYACDLFQCLNSLLQCDYRVLRSMTTLGCRYCIHIKSYSKYSLLNLLCACVRASVRALRSMTTLGDRYCKSGSSVRWKTNMVFEEKQLPC